MTALALNGTLSSPRFSGLKLHVVRGNLHPIDTQYSIALLDNRDRWVKPDEIVITRGMKDYVLARSKDVGELSDLLGHISTLPPDEARNWLAKLKEQLPEVLLEILQPPPKEIPEANGKSKRPLIEYFLRKPQPEADPDFSAANKQARLERPGNPPLTVLDYYRENGKAFIKLLKWAQKKRLRFEPFQAPFNNQNAGKSLGYKGMGRISLILNPIRLPNFSDPLEARAFLNNC